MSKLLKYTKLLDTDFSISKEKSNIDTFTTAENIPFKTSYDSKDLADIQHLQFLPGTPPYLGGPYASMYKSRPWTIRQ